MSGFSIEKLSRGFQVWLDGECIGNDTPLLDGFYAWALSDFYGEVQADGLGPGAGVRYLCGLPAVLGVRCVERSLLIIERFGFQHPKLEIVHADAFAIEHPPCDCAFLDVWGDCNVPPSDVASLEARHCATRVVSLPSVFNAYLKSLK